MLAHDDAAVLFGHGHGLGDLVASPPHATPRYPRFTTSSASICGPTLSEMTDMMRTSWKDSVGGEWYRGSCVHLAGSCSREVSARRSAAMTHVGRVVLHHRHRSGILVPGAGHKMKHHDRCRASNDRALRRRPRPGSQCSGLHRAHLPDHRSFPPCYCHTDHHHAIHTIHTAHPSHLPPAHRLSPLSFAVGSDRRPYSALPPSCSLARLFEVLAHNVYYLFAFV